ncbi:MAG: hypothetical protein LCH37_11265 [Bacteroidetes bacterium]|nr:hypothetical protein [Bacteroidota bacterium]
MKLRFIKLVFIVVMLVSNLFAQTHYGLYMSMNFPTVSGHIPNYVGRGLGGFGAFIQAPFSPYHSNSFINRFDFSAESGLTYIGFRDKQSDFRYNNYYFDPSFYINFIPDRQSDAMRIMLGFRPSYLLFQNNEDFNMGNYQIVRNEWRNAYQQGDLDFGLAAGISVSLGSIARAELKYTHSFTQQLSNSYVRGRPSFVEFGLKLSAVDIRESLMQRDKDLAQQLENASKGTLLVMLGSTDKKVLEKMIRAGKKEEAAHLVKMEQIAAQNQKQAFERYFDFCKVLYFSDTSANEVAAGNFRGVMDSEGRPASFDTSNYMLAAFCEDASDYTNKIDYGLYFYDKNFQQLKKPFNVSANFLGIFAGGDPVNYFKRARYLHTSSEFTKVVKRASARMQRSRAVRQN